MSMCCWCGIGVGRESPEKSLKKNLVGLENDFKKSELSIVFVLSWCCYEREEAVLVTLLVCVGDGDGDGGVVCVSVGGGGGGGLLSLSLV